MTLPAIDFHAHHRPLGAWCSFTCGAHSEGGGFGLESGAIPQQRRTNIGWAENEQRHYDFVHDRFTVGGFSFALFTQVQAPPEASVAPIAAERLAYLPAIAGELAFDTWQGTSAIAVVSSSAASPS